MQTNKALPCRRCGTDEMLKWKTWAEVAWWIVCDGCGQRGPECSRQSDAGHGWNAQQEKEPDHV